MSEQFPALFQPLQLRHKTLRNRIVVAPMHQYAAIKGVPTDWHVMNAGRYAAGGAGLSRDQTSIVVFPRQRWPKAARP